MSEITAKDYRIPEELQVALERWDAGVHQPKLFPPQRETALQNKVAIDNTVGQPHFLDACAAAQVKPSRRQASKFLRKRGLAYREGLDLPILREEDLKGFGVAQ